MDADPQASLTIGLDNPQPDQLPVTFTDLLKKVLTDDLILTREFGGLGILAGSIRGWVCIPFSIRLHDGLQAASCWKGASVFLLSD